ncbi:MAG: hypothetical protein GWP02_08130 [Desulfobulbaceae bacterium]|nr:hypothetical protein [Desulfobulbaceae bacterium]
MCLVVLAFDAHPEFPLIVAGNRDEFHSRPTQDANWWPDDTNIVGGRDLLAGGTWLAVHRSGRFATVTNYRDAETKAGKLRSRGHLVTEFLRSDLSPIDYLRSIDGALYAGFNLLVADAGQLAYLSNEGDELRELPAGIYGLSNATLDTPWAKVERSKSRLESLIENGDVNQTQLLRLLNDREKGPLDEVRPGRLPYATAHAITAPFIVLPDYGTRCSSVIQLASDGRCEFLERRFDANGKQSGESRLSFSTGVS